MKAPCTATASGTCATARAGPPPALPATVVIDPATAARATVINTRRHASMRGKCCIRGLTQACHITALRPAAKRTLDADKSCARNVWFWCVREVGQSRAEVPDLRRLTDVAAGRVIGSRPDQRQSWSGNHMHVPCNDEMACPQDEIAAGSGVSVYTPTPATTP